jgi:hypothetical protein
LRAVSGFKRRKSKFLSHLSGQRANAVSPETVGGMGRSLCRLFLVRSRIESVEQKAINEFGSRQGARV